MDSKSTENSTTRTAQQDAASSTKIRQQTPARLTMQDVDSVKGYDPTKPRKVPVKPW